MLVVDFEHPAVVELAMISQAIPLQVVEAHYPIASVRDDIDAVISVVAAALWGRPAALRSRDCDRDRVPEVWFSAGARQLGALGPP